MFLQDFDEACRRHVARPAIFIDGKAHTYGELAERISAIHAAIVQQPAEPYVGIVAYDHLDTYAALFATLLAGRCYVPINPGHPGSRNKAIVEQAELGTVFSARSSDLAEVLGGDVRAVIRGSDCVAGTKPAIPELPPDTVAYLLFTSGSSGVPKGVPITHGNIDAFLGSFFESGGPIDENDRVLQMFDLTFDFSVVAYFAPLCRGACIYTVPPDAIKFTFIGRLLEDAQLTHLPLVPSVLTQLRPYFAELELPSVKHTFFCGEALHADLLAGWAACAPGSRLTNYYGPTEATVFAMYYRWERADEAAPRAHNGIVSIGKAMDGMRAIIVDDDATHPLGVGAQGELCLAGPQVTPGYFKDPERNARVFFETEGQRFYRTGDLARLEADGTFTFVGRRDYQVKVQGYRVELAEIEHHARLLASGSDAAVVDVRSANGVMRLHMFLGGFAGDVPALVASLKERVPHYMVPSTTNVLPALPLNANGKVDRLQLRKRAEDTAESEKKGKTV